MMAVKLELKPEIEAGLAAQARARGLTLEAYVDEVLRTAADAFVASRGGDNWVVKKPFAGSTASKRPEGKKSLAQLFAESPLKGLDLKFERDPDTGRPVKL